MACSCAEAALILYDLDEMMLIHMYAHKRFDLISWTVTRKYGLCLLVPRDHTPLSLALSCPESHVATLGGERVCPEL